jgi:2,3-bisphosphoglycerate-dependent phosphoglycerate mutase
MKLSRANGDGGDLSSPRTVTSLDPVPPHIHRIVLMRHGESEFNNANVFTGWSDIGLTSRGKVEAEEAGQVFASHGLTFRKCYASVLTRAIVTAHRSLEAAGVSYTPLVYDWRLNERHYGALQGLSKERTAERLGRSIVMKWRRSYEARPPLMTPGHPHYDSIVNDDRYQSVRDKIPLGESLAECQIRVVEAWKDIIKDLQTAQHHESPYSLLVAHANTLRALVMHIDEIPSDEIEGLNIPTGIPFYLDVDKETGEVLTGSGRFTGVYIADERKKRSFLERRRAANDPYLWALRDEQVARHMLLEEATENIFDGAEGLEGIEQEAARNTQLFSPSMIQGKKESDKQEAQLSRIRDML